MREKTPIERRRARILKVQRTLIRLKYSLMADEELDRTLPETLRAFDESVGGGHLPMLEATLTDVLSQQ